MLTTTNRRINAFTTMLRTEFRLSLRDMNMVIFAILMPLVVLIIIGLIYSNKPAFPGAEYTFLQQSFGALASISIVAGGVMGLPLVISDYRDKKILKRYRVTPVSPVMLLMVQVVIYSIYAVVSLILLYLAAALLWGYRMPGPIFHFVYCYILVLLSMFSIGLMVGGIAPNSKMAGVIASILYFPMLIFSGATLPYEIMPVPLQRIADLLPMTQGIKLLKAASLGQTAANGIMIPSLAMAILAIICITISITCFRWDS